MPEHGKPLLEAKLEPVSHRDAVAAPVVQVHAQRVTAGTGLDAATRRTRAPRRVIRRG
jgi:hypothetical protein